MGDLLPTLVDIVWHLEPPPGDSNSPPTVCLERMEEHQPRGGTPVRAMMNFCSAPVSRSWARMDDDDFATGMLTI